MQDLLQVCSKKESASALSLSRNNSYVSSGSRHQESGSKGHQLVCAAKNLHLSLMRCQWMVEVQKLLGIGRFASNNGRVGQEIPQSELNPEQNQKRKDIIKVCELSDSITDLNLQGIVDNFKDQDAEYVEVLRQMRELQVFTIDFKLLFMPLPTQQAKTSVPSVHHMAISIGPQNFERIS